MDPSIYRTAVSAPQKRMNSKHVRNPEPGHLSAANKLNTVKVTPEVLADFSRGWCVGGVSLGLSCVRAPSAKMSGPHSSTGTLFVTASFARMSKEGFANKVTDTIFSFSENEERGLCAEKVWNPCGSCSQRFQLASQGVHLPACSQTLQSPTPAYETA